MPTYVLAAASATLAFSFGPCRSSSTRSIGVYGAEVYSDPGQKCTDVQRWIRDPLNLCDLMAILPLYVEAFMSQGTSV